MQSMASPSAPLLKANNVSINFGGIHALKSMSLEVHEGQKVGLIGPNGAGKTTLFNCISRLVKETSGTITFQGNRLNSLTANKIIELGISRTFQGVALAKEMTVLDNVKVGHGNKFHRTTVAQALVPSYWSATERSVEHRAKEILELLHLEEFAYLYPLDLPFGTQKRIELARALMSSPQLLMLDEPANGLTLTEVRELEILIREVCEKFNTTLLVVEHNMGFVNSLCEKVFVMDAGALLAHGTPIEIQNNPEVIKAYLGSKEDSDND